MIRRKVQIDERERRWTMDRTTTLRAVRLVCGVALALLLVVILFG